MMKKMFVLLLMMAIYSCEKSNISLYNDSNYPTVYKKKTPSELAEMRASYFSENKNIQSSLNEFGFCGSQSEDRFVAYPPQTAPLEQSQAEAKALSFLSGNKIYAGISDLNALRFVNTQNSSGYGGNQFWHLKTTIQKIDTIEVLFTSILVHICNGEVYLCNGNWYPHIYIPAKFTFSHLKAKERLVNRVVSHYTIAAQKYHVRITSSEISNSSTRLVIYPLTKDDRIELRVTWEVNIPGPVFYKIFVDVMTGEIISEVPTIIS